MPLTILISERAPSLCAKKTFHILQIHTNLIAAMREVKSKRYLQHQPAALLAEVPMVNGLAQEHRHKIGRTATNGTRH
jgi:hypothetical protein